MLVWKPSSGLHLPAACNAHDMQGVISAPRLSGKDFAAEASQCLDKRELPM